MTCDPCSRFFARFRCNTPGECDCPRCQGLCRCGRDPDAWGGKIGERGGVLTVLAGKYAGTPVDRLPGTMVHWIVFRSDWPADVKRIVADRRGRGLNIRT